MKAAALMSLLLVGCVSFPKLPHASVPVVSAPAAPVCPGDLVADLQAAPVVPAGSGFPAPQTDAESQTVTAYTTWLHLYGVWAREGWRRTGLAKSYCSTAH